MPRRLIAALVLLWSIPVFAEDVTSALINQQLDKQIKELKLNQLLPQAMETIQQQTDVPIKFDPAVWDVLPWGRDTNVGAKIEGQTLRQALEAITRKLGLKFEVKDNAVVISATAPLLRLARRSTAQELRCLETLGKEMMPQAGPTTLKALLDSVDAALAKAQSEFVIDRPAADTIRLDTPVDVPRNSTLLDALEKMADQSSTTWYPWGKAVVVLAKQDEIKRQLGRTVTVRYNGVDVAQVLTELSQRAGVKFDVEAGAIQQVPPEARNIRLVLDDYSIQDALEAIGGVTGLDFMVKDTGVYIWNQTSSATHRDPVLIIMTIRGTDMQVLIPTSQVPSDIREYCKQKQQKEFDAIREMMKEEGFHPSSPAPSTKPAATKGNEDL
jgi:hypothetical protein